MRRLGAGKVDEQRRMFLEAAFREREERRPLTLRNLSDNESEAIREGKVTAELAAKMSRIRWDRNIIIGVPEEQIEALISQYGFRTRPARGFPQKSEGDRVSISVHIRGEKGGAPYGVHARGIAGPPRTGATGDEGNP